MRLGCGFIKNVVNVSRNMVLAPKHQLYRYQILPQEVNLREKLRLVALESYLLNVAGFAAQENGFGSMGMIERGVTWVLSRLGVEMTSLPNQYEWISIETWVQDYGRIATVRNFIIRDSEERVIGYAMSQWALIDINTRRPVDLRNYPEFTVFATGETVPITPPARVPVLDDIPVVGEHKVVYSDIDFNGHTNSMKYIEWMLDTIEPEYHYAHQVRRFDVNYVHEITQGQTAVLLRAEHEGSMVFEVSNGETVACRAMVHWLENE